MRFKKPEYKTLEDCNALEDYLFQMAIIIDVRRGKREIFKNLFLKCQQKISKEFSTILYFPFLSNLEEVKTYLKENGLSLKERLKIQSSFYRKQKIKEIKNKIIDLIDVLASEESLNSPEKRHEILLKVKMIPILWWERLFSLLIATEAKNRPWSLELKRELAKSSPYVFLIKGIPFDEIEMVKIREFILKVLTRYKDEFNDIEGVKILADRFNGSLESGDFKTIKEKVDADWSLSELREKFDNPLLRSEFFDFWYMVMMNRTSDSELRSRIRKALSYRALNSAQYSQLWVLEYFLPVDEKMRKLIVRQLSKMWVSNSLVHQYTVLRASRNQPLKKILSQSSKEFEKPDFKIVREYFDKLLNSGYSTHFALYELYYLGDKNPENLWWLIL